MPFSFISPKNALWREAKVAKTHQRILEKITSLPDVIRKDRYNMELLKMVCCLVENSIDNKGKKDKLKIDKKDLVCQIYSSLFSSLTPQDIETISKNIEYLHDNEQIIKYSAWVIVSSNIIEWFKKKVVS